MKKNMKISLIALVTGLFVGIGVCHAGGGTLKEAIDKGDAAKVGALVNPGNINRETIGFRGKKWTPLAYSFLKLMATENDIIYARKHVEIQKVLLEHGADPSAAKLMIPPFDMDVYSIGTALLDIGDIHDPEMARLVRNVMGMYREHGARIDDAAVKRFKAMFAKDTRKAARSVVQADLANLRTYLEAYAMVHDGRYPRSFSEISKLGFVLRNL